MESVALRLCLWVFCIINVCSFTAFQYNKHLISMKISSNNDNPNNNNNKVKSTKFDRIIDDFIGKKYGSGQYFYGPRTSGLSEEEYAKLRGVDINASKKKDDNENDDNFEFKPNSILLYGDIDTNSDYAIGQWIAFELLEKGFNVRIVCKNKKEGFQAFGPNGKNVDYIYLDSTSDEKFYARAIEGVQAIIFCHSFQPTVDYGLFNIFTNNNLINDKNKMLICEKLINFASMSRKAKIGDIKKIVYLSRYLSPSYMNENINKNNNNRIDNSKYDEFRQLHFNIENLLRKSGIEYGIIRAPTDVDVIRDASTYNLIVNSCKENSVKNSIVVGNKCISILDLAEASTQLLLQDVDRITVTVEEEVMENTNNRVKRVWYYGILNMNDNDMKMSYMIKPAEAYKSQLDEDEMVEKYWFEKFLLVEKDNIV